MTIKNPKIKIAQVLPSFSKGDAIGNFVLEIDEILKDANYDPSIYARINKEGEEGRSKQFSELSENKPDLILYHHSIGDELVDTLLELDIPIIIYYHNITPAEYYDQINDELCALLDMGREQLKQLSTKVICAIAASDFSIVELESYGFERVNKIPVFFNSTHIEQLVADETTAEELRGFEGDNILYVSRISRHKGQVDILKSFYLYCKHFKQECKLHLV